MGEAISNYLIISDLQIPFEHPKALAFCKDVQKDFKIPKENILCVGDEVDQYYGSRYNKDPDVLDFTPRKELLVARERIAEWVATFPVMRLCVSNHGLRWLSKAHDAQIPSELLIPYKKLFNMPRGWQFREEWLFKEKHPFRMIHGMGYSGVMGARNAAIDGRVSTVIGHLHSHAGVHFINNGAGTIWGLNAGSLIDEGAFAFKYSKYTRFKSIISCAVVLDGGKHPVVIQL